MASPLVATLEDFETEINECIFDNANKRNSYLPG